MRSDSHHESPDMVVEIDVEKSRTDTYSEALAARVSATDAASIERGLLAKTGKRANAFRVL